MIIEATREFPRLRRVSQAAPSFTSHNTDVTCLETGIQVATLLLISWTPTTLNSHPFRVSTSLIMAIGGAILRISQTVLRAIQLCCAIVACGVFAYFIAVLSSRDETSANYIRAVAGMSGAAIIYTASAVLLTLCFAGVAFLGYIAIVLDICFAGCFAAIAYYSRGGARSCSGLIDTPIGDGSSNSARLRRACQLQTAVFAVSIVAM